MRSGLPVLARWKVDLVDKWIVDNYAALRESRGWSWSQVAEHVRAHGGSAELADHLESLGKSAPVERAEQVIERAVKSAPEKRG